jgi:hypothetical protein
MMARINAAAKMKVEDLEPRPGRYVHVMVVPAGVERA